MKSLSAAALLFLVGCATAPRLPLPDNPATVPAAKLEEDCYDWYGRHEEILRIKEQVDPEVVFIGDSITHQWGGVPAPGGQPSPGEGVLGTTLGTYRTLNLGFGWDRTQNVLWRIDHGELDGLHPKAVIIHIGTNNTSDGHARLNTAPEIAGGIDAVCRRVHAKVPHAQIILMAIFPREAAPDHPRRRLIHETNRLLPAIAADNHAIFVDLTCRMLAPNGELPSEISRDHCHLTTKGYQIWAEALAPILESLK